jgi:hypothetical protein
MAFMLGYSLVAGTAPRRLGLAGEGRSRETVGKVVVHGPRGLVGAGEGRATITAGLGVGVADALEVCVAGVDGLVNEGLAGPRARRLAAVPVSAT